MDKIRILKIILLRFFFAVLYLFIGGTCALQGIRIAEAGTAAQIPQLEGDGGGNFLYGDLIVIAGILFIFKPRLAALLILLSSLLGMLVSLIYQDEQLIRISMMSLISGCVILLSPLLTRVIHAAIKKAASMKRPKITQIL